MAAPRDIYKLHGTGNDFVVMRSEHPLAHASWAEPLCDRHRGVGADGLLILSESADYDVRLRIVNADGSQPEMCGNGVRCVARYLVEHEGMPDELVVESDAGPRPIRVVSKGPGPWKVAVDMGRAVVAPPVELEHFGQIHRARPVDMGNPHAVVFVDELPSMAHVDEWGGWVNESHPIFPEGVNLEFVTETDGRLDVVVYERGVGRTLACGTGACAVAAAAWADDRVADAATVVGLPGGDLRIEKSGEKIWMTGEVESVFQATVDETWVEQRKRGQHGS